jgi:hypothetical protein
MSTLTGTFELASWDEQTVQELQGERKLTRAVVTQTFTGDLQGKGAVEWLMCYSEDGTARFVGMQRIDGSVDDRSGSVVLETVGEFDGSTAAGTWTVIPGSATSGLAGISGGGRFEAPHGPTATYTMDVEFDLAALV